MRLASFSIILCGLMLASCSTTNNSVVQEKAQTKQEINNESEKLNAWFEERYKEELAFSPISLTMQGYKDRYDELGDFSEEFEDEVLAWKRASVEQMKAQFDYNALDDEAKTSWDLWQYQYDKQLQSKEFRTQGYVFHQMGGVHTFLPTFMINFHKVDTLKDMQDYIARLNKLKVAASQLVVIAEQSAEAGVHAPRFAYDIVSDQINKIISGAPFSSGSSEKDSALWSDVKSKVQSLLDSKIIDQAQADQLTEQGRQALVNSVGPGYQEMLGFLSHDYANTSEKAKGVSELPNGMNYYNYRLSAMTTTDMTAEQIHQLGLSEVKRLRAEMEAVKVQTGFKGSLQEFFTFQRDSKNDPRFYFQDPETGAQGYIDEATQAISNIKKVLPQYFGILPKADLIVKRVESFREQDGAAQHYFAGTPDGSRPGIYYAHLSDMSAMPRGQLEVIAYHEGLPGHHMQISIAQELTGIPTFRTQADATAYAEGWGLYAEYLAKEMPNTYQDAYSEFGRLGSEMFRAIRLVIDTGMHAKGWSQQEAIDYFSENSPEPLASIESEVMRYLVIPGQATSYKIGMLDILRLREMAKTQLGDAFDIREFHDVILSGGALPLNLLDRRVEQWLAKKKG